jgi:hypothetical protein
MVIEERLAALGRAATGLAISGLILELWGAEAGQHARSAIGVAELPFGRPVEIEAEGAIA